ncbi:MAG TPA: molybdopterin-dependent oxidoreductase [Opitutaceae bacterium]
MTTPEGSLELSAADFAALPHKEVSAFDPHGKASHKYSGVAMADLLLKAGAPLGERLRGNAQRSIVIIRSRDNYEVVYALAEFDPAFSDRTIILADAEDGRPIGPAAGPYRVVAPGDKKAARWAKMVASIDVRPADPSVQAIPGAPGPSH